MSECYRFECRGCDSAIIVDPLVRRSILENGCPLCETRAVTPDFELVPDCEPEVTPWTYPL